VKPQFIPDSKWPISKEPEERVADPSYDKQIEDHLMDEIMMAMEEKHSSKLREALVALIEHLKMSEE
jgi:hypothetical protein